MTSSPTAGHAAGHDGDSGSRGPTLVWVIALLATFFAAALLSAEIASGLVARVEMRRTCSAHPPLAISGYMWATMLLSGIGAGAGIVVVVKATRVGPRLVAIVVVSVCVVLFFLGWYGFALRHDSLMAPCSNM